MSLLLGLLLVLVDVHHGALHIQELLKIMFNRFPCRTFSELNPDITKKCSDYLLGLLIVLIVDVHHVFHYGLEVLKIISISFPLSLSEKMYEIAKSLFHLLLAGAGTELTNRGS